MDHGQARLTLIVDANAFLAQADTRDPDYNAVTEVLRAEQSEIVTSQFVVAEADYMIFRRFGLRGELAFLRDMEENYIADSLTTREITSARGVVEKYADLSLGITDASLVVLAARWATTRILTLDERAFRTVKPLQGGTFTVLPADNG